MTSKLYIFPSFMIVCLQLKPNKHYWKLTWEDTQLQDYVSGKMQWKRVLIPQDDFQHTPACLSSASSAWVISQEIRAPGGRPLGGTSPLLSKGVKHADMNEPASEWSSPGREKFQGYFSWVSQSPVFLYRTSLLPLLNHTRNVRKRRTEKITDLWAVLVIFISSLQSWVKESCACLQLSPAALSQLPKNIRSPGVQALKTQLGTQREEEALSRELLSKTSKPHSDTGRTHFINKHPGKAIPPFMIMLIVSSVLKFLPSSL